MFSRDFSNFFLYDLAWWEKIALVLVVGLFILTITTGLTIIVLGLLGVN